MEQFLSARYLSGRNANQKIGVTSSTENQKVLEVIGNVGIGSTIFEPTEKLDVRGSVSVADTITASTVNATTVVVTGTGNTFADLTVTGISTFGGNIDANGNLDVDGLSDLDELNVAGIATFASDIDINASIDVDGHTELDDLNVSGVSTFIGGITGTISTATQLETARDFEITGSFVTAPAISFDGTGNVSLAATITPDSIGLGTYTSGDYVKSITGTSNEIEVTGGSGEGSTPQIGLPNDVTITQDLTVNRDVQIVRNLNVDGNITIGGTSATLFTQTLTVADADLVLGVRTDALGNDISTDNTANHGGIAIASTEGNPLVTLVNPGAGETLPNTYKKIMWFKSGSFAGLGTDAWLANYAVGVGSTQLPSGTRFAAGNVQITEDDISVVRNINASGIITGTLDNTLTLNTSGTGLSGSTTYDNSGAATFTVASDATDANTAGTIVSRDGSGNFSAGTISANLSGTATTATNLADGANITTGTISDDRLPDLITSNINIASGISSVATLDSTNATIDNLTFTSGTAITSVDTDLTAVSASDDTLASAKAIKTYVDAQITAQDLDFAGDSGTGAVDLDSQSLTISGTASEIETSATGQTLSIGLPNQVAITTSLTVGSATTITSVGIVAGIVTATSFDGNLALSDITGLGANVSTFLATPSSSNLASAVTDETGSGALVFADSPTLITPVLGVATATSLSASGIITATGGFNLGISSAGSSITSGPVTTLNFIGAGNTFAVDGTTVDISIAGGGGGGVGIDTNTENQNQLVTYATSFGSTTGLGATNTLTFNPSSGTLTAPIFSGDGSGLTGVSGFASALSSDSSSPLFRIYTEDRTLTVTSGVHTITADADADYLAFTKADLIIVSVGATLEVSSGTTFRTNILDLFPGEGDLDVTAQDLNVLGVSTFAGDVNVGVNTSNGIVLTSPNGTKYRLIVDNSGNLSTTAV